MGDCPAMQVVNSQLYPEELGPRREVRADSAGGRQRAVSAIAGRAPLHLRMVRFAAFCALYVVKCLGEEAQSPPPPS